MDDLIQEPTNENENVGKGENNRRILNEPVNYSLIEIFKELKFGRPAASHKLKFISYICC